jgi:hypothetical protein
MQINFNDEALTQPVRVAIHAFALNGRELLTREAHDQLEGMYGLHHDGTLEAPENLPALKDVTTHQTYERLQLYLKDETGAGLTADEAVKKLVKEVAFTHINRLVAFKMLETSKLIREAVGRGLESNGFKFYLADHPDDEALWRGGEGEAAYQHFLLWRAGEFGREIPVLFDPETLASSLFPRQAVLTRLLDWLNATELVPAWQAEETIGWVYQFFNERENSAVFDRLFKQKKKIRRQDIPAATQRYTPRWIVRYLVENTLGRLWLNMHPDSALAPALRYLVPLEGKAPVERLRPVCEISLLDPACGTMHFGLVAFDLFVEMYREELAKAGQPGWPAKVSVTSEADIPAAIIEHNLFGIDIDLRAVQLAALTLYLKAKRLNKFARISDHNLACADVTPFSTADLGRFLVQMRFSNPIFEKMLRGIREQLGNIQQVGSLLRIEQELQRLVDEQRRKDEQKHRTKYGDMSAAPRLLDAVDTDAMESEYYAMLETQLVQALDFFRQQMSSQGEDLTFFTGEAAKSLRILDLFLRRYDVVLANPPYMSRRSMNGTMASFLDTHYPEAKGDLYAAFIARCAELAEADGRVGMITQQSFMFISSYRKLRTGLLETCAIETMAHTGPRAFPEIKGEKVNTTAFVLRREADPARRRASQGTYFRLVHAPDADSKRAAFELALTDPTPLPANVYRLSQRDFDAIPGTPLVYWLNTNIRDLFNKLDLLSDVGISKVGINTGHNERFIRWHWEVLKNPSTVNWQSYVSGGPKNRYYGNLFYFLNWSQEEMNEYPGSALRAREYQGKEGITYGLIGSSKPTFRYLPSGYIFSSGGNCIFMDKTEDLLALLGILNSGFSTYILKIINPTINLSVGDILRLPVAKLGYRPFNKLVLESVRIGKYKDILDETTIDFIIPGSIDAHELLKTTNRQTELDIQINNEVFTLYGISPEDRAAIEAELDRGQWTEDGENDEGQKPENEEETLPGMSLEELAARWVSYAIGIVLGRFRVGSGKGKVESDKRLLGSAVYHREYFAIGSLPAPDEDEFNELVGTPDQFAYIDEHGGRHVFFAEVERALDALAFEDGIAVLEAGHTRDLVTRVEKALVLMLGEKEFEEVMAAMGSGQASTVLRQLLEKDYFTKWHVKKNWYRNRPIYWPIQSAKRAYGFVLFHEKITRDTFYAIQRKPYLDTKRQAIANAIGDLQSDLPGKQGAARKKAEKDLDDLRKLSAELEEFAKELESITMGGYNPAPDWIDDGVILRMAPLWKIIPNWKAEPKKYWERLKAGDFDWSRIAMNYWPERVREKCKIKKSYAIAHGHEEWFEG